MSGNHMVNTNESLFPPEAYRDIKKIFLERKLNKSAPCTPKINVVENKERDEVMREIWPDHEDFDQARAFYNAIEQEMWWARNQLLALEEEVCKEDVRKELKYLRKCAEGIAYKLPTPSGDNEGIDRISRSVLRLLPIESDYVEWGVICRQMEHALTRALMKAETLTPKKKKESLQRSIKKEMALRILRIAKEYGFAISTTVLSETAKNKSDAIKLLECIDKYIGFSSTPWSQFTWKDLVIELKQEDHLQQ